MQVKTQETGQDGMCFGVGGGVGRGPDAGRSQGLEEHNAQAGLQVLADRTAIGSASDLEGSACRDFGHLGDLCRVLVAVAVGLQALGDFDRVDEEAKVLPIIGVALAEAAVDLIHAAKLDSNIAMVGGDGEMRGRDEPLRPVPRYDLLVRHGCCGSERQECVLLHGYLGLGGGFESLYFLHGIAKECLDHLNFVQCQGL